MNLKGMNKILYFNALFALGFLLLFVDFISKAYVNDLFPFAGTHPFFAYHERPVFNGLFGGINFSIVLAYNQGIAWGLFNNYPYFILALRFIVVMALLCYMFFIKKERAGDLAYTLIIAGAIGNIVDCWMYGSVVDFLRFDLWGYTFPIFNIADTLITVGVFLLFASGMRKEKAIIQDNV